MRERRRSAAARQLLRGLVACWGLAVALGTCSYGVVPQPPPGSEWDPLRSDIKCTTPVCPSVEAEFCPAGACDWTDHGQNCNEPDDGSECYCRCCCAHMPAEWECLWSRGRKKPGGLHINEVCTAQCQKGFVPASSAVPFETFTCSADSNEMEHPIDSGFACVPDRSAKCSTVPPCAGDGCEWEDSCDEPGVMDGVCKARCKAGYVPEGGGQDRAVDYACRDPYGVDDWAWEALGADPLRCIQMCPDDPPLPFQYQWHLGGRNDAINCGPAPYTDETCKVDCSTGYHWEEGSDSHCEGDDDNAEAACPAGTDPHCCDCLQSKCGAERDKGQFECLNCVGPSYVTICGCTDKVAGQKSTWCAKPPANPNNVGWFKCTDGSWVRDSAEIECRCTANICPATSVNEPVHGGTGCSEGRLSSNQTISGCRISCAEGYEKYSGSGEYRCSSHGEWVPTGNALVCVPSCDTKLPVPHADLEGCKGQHGRELPMVGEYCTGQCAAGYVESGSVQYNCTMLNDRAQWLHVPSVHFGPEDGELQCVLSKDAKPCLADVPAKNLHFLDCNHTLAAAECVAECDDGYEADDGDPTFMCDAAGRWVPKQYLDQLECKVPAKGCRQGLAPYAIAGQPVVCTPCVPDDVRAACPRPVVMNWLLLLIPVGAALLLLLLLFAVWGGPTLSATSRSVWIKAISWVAYMVASIAVVIAFDWQFEPTLAGPVLTVATATSACWIVPHLKQQLDDPEPLQIYPAPTGGFGLSMHILGFVGAVFHVAFCISLLQCGQVGLFVCAVSTSALTMATTVYLILCTRSKILEHADSAEWYRTDSHGKQTVCIMILSTLRLDSMALLRLRICSSNLQVECPMRPEHFQWLRYAGIYHCVMEDLAYVIIAGLKLSAGCHGTSAPEAGITGLIQQYGSATAVLRIVLSGCLIIANVCEKSGQWQAHRQAKRGVHLRESLLPGEGRAQEQLEQQDVAGVIVEAEGGVFTNEHVGLLRPHGWRNQIVGRGAFGIVYKAEWNGREVAVKEIVLPQEPHDATAAAKRLLRDNTRKVKAEFVKEAQIAGKHSHHPNLVRLLGWADEPNLYLVQEFLRGQSLHSQLYVEGWQPAPAEVLKVALDVARGMTHLHEAFDAPVIHRDLKSANLMLTAPPVDDPSFVVKITDFGLTRESHADATMTASTVGGGGGAAGTVLWMAPELVLGEGSYDEKVDVFSYAMCLIELINREKPWQGAGVRQETISVHLVQGKRPEHQLERAHTELKGLIRDCWHRDASRRPAFSGITARVEAMLGVEEAAARAGGGREWRDGPPIAEQDQEQQPPRARAHDVGVGGGGELSGVSRPASPGLPVVPELLEGAE